MRANPAMEAHELYSAVVSRPRAKVSEQLSYLFMYGMYILTGVVPCNGPNKVRGSGRPGLGLEHDPMYVPTTPTARKTTRSPLRMHLGLICSAVSCLRYNSMHGILRAILVDAQSPR